MKFLVLIFSFALIIPATQAFATEVINDEQGGSYVPFEEFKLSWSDKLFEIFAGKFQEVKDSYCISNAKQACRRQLVMQACKINLNQTEGSCPDACKAWAKDCQKTSDRAIRKNFGDDLEEGG